MKASTHALRALRAAKLLVLGLACVVSAQAMGQRPNPPVVIAIDGGTVLPPVPPSSSGDIPLSWDSTIFSNMVTSGALTLGSGQSRTGLSINEQSGSPSISCNGACNLERIRIRSREGVRCSSGAINLTSMYIEATGTGSDHADGLQCYSPGSTGAVTVKNTTFKMAGSTTAGYFSADNWRGSHVFENVLFWGGNHGLRIPGDGGSSVRLKNVYFVRDSFNFGAFLFDVVNGTRVDIQQWENVRWVTIQNGQLVMGAEIARPN